MTTAEPKKSRATELLEMANRRYTLGRDSEDGTLYAVDILGPNVALPIGSRYGLRPRLAAQFAAEKNVVADSKSLGDVVNALIGMAGQAEPSTVWTRVARHEDSVVIDLGDTAGRAIVIGGGAWRVIDRSPVTFRRTANLTLAWPEPERPHDPTAVADLLAERLHLDPATAQLLVAWMVAALIPDLPHPILAVGGEQGSAKTTLAKAVIGFIDPTTATTRRPPRDAREWSSTAGASWAFALDNLSEIPMWWANSLCCAVTGAADVGRALYTDAEVTVLQIRRVMALTYIALGAIPSDLAERLLVIESRPIRPDQRLTERQVDEAMTKIRPFVAGALLQILAGTLQHLDQVRLDTAPRMADFAQILAAVDTATGWRTLQTYLAGVDRTYLDVLADDPLAAAVLELAEQDPEWTGPAGELLDVLRDIATGHTDRPLIDFPKTGHGLSAALVKMAPNLRKAGVDVTRNRTNKFRTVTVRRLRDADDAGDAPIPSVSRDAGDAGDALAPINTPPLWERDKGDGEGETKGDGASPASPPSPDAWSSCRLCGAAFTDEEAAKARRIVCFACQAAKGRASA